MAEPTNSKDLLSMTTEIVASHVRNNSVPQGELAELIRTVHAALSEVSTGNSHEKPSPAIAVRRSVTPEYIVCLEDGKKLKMLKRHLKTAYDMTPEEYRERWSLPADYPMVAPNYARQRSALAKKIGLGRRPGRG
jgi:predicted transcriptional regulator